MRFSIDTGGTFTDLAVEDAGNRQLFKAQTTPADPLEGVFDAFERAAAALDTGMRALLERGELIVHATTHPLNAVLTGATARTGLLVTEGHEAVLVLREGGRADPFDFSHEYPEPFVPQALTFGVRERIGSAGEVLIELTEAAAGEVARRLGAARVEAVAVCLLWSVANPVHERLLGAVLASELPGVPVTLSHALNPSIREYRRASSTAIDASLRPLMSGYLTTMLDRLCDAGFTGRLLVASSTGALLDAHAAAGAPLHTLKSGPAMAPIAGAFELARLGGALPGRAGAVNAIVTDTGGTSFDVSVVRAGRVSRTRETWLGRPFRSVMTGFPSVDVRSIGAGGGSIARVDGGGLLHVGPASAGAVPGPVAYGRGGTQVTVTDAALVLGYLDPRGLLDGTLALDADAARAAVSEQIAAPLQLDVPPAAAAVLELATELMAQAVEDVTTQQGIDPGGSVLVGGGGAAGLNLAAIAARLGCRRALLPHGAPALSAVGALVGDLASDYAVVHTTGTATFDHAGVNAALRDLRRRCEEFIAAAGPAAAEARVELFAEARYPRQVWELEVPLRAGSFEDQSDLDRLIVDFHDHHEAAFGFADRASPIDLIAWRARATCELPRAPVAQPAQTSPTASAPEQHRIAWFAGLGSIKTPVHALAQLPDGAAIPGPAIIETGLTTVVLGPGDHARRLTEGTLELTRERSS